MHATSTYGIKFPLQPNHNMWFLIFNNCVNVISCNCGVVPNFKDHTVRASFAGDGAVAV